MMEITVSSRGQVCIPRGVREKYGIGRGTRLKVMDEGDGIKLIPPAKLGGLCGTWEMDREEIEEELEENRKNWR